MTLDSFERLLHLFNKRQPFRPYLIAFSNGDKIEVRHPEVITTSAEIFGFRAPNREQRFFETDSVIQFIYPAPPQA